ASFFAGCVGTLLIALVGPPLADFAFQFRSPEYFSLMILGLIMASMLTQGSALKGVGMVLLGILLGSVGTDINSGSSRYIFGINELREGFDFSVVAMGVFAISELAQGIQSSGAKDAISTKIGRLWLSMDEFVRSWKAVL